MALPVTDGIGLSYHPDQFSGGRPEAVQDQVFRFIHCLASLPDRTLLMKCRGVRVPFILQVHAVSDPYEEKKLFRCREVREHELKQYVANVRKAHEFYFLPSLDDLPVPAPAPKQEIKKPKRKIEEMTS